MNRHIRFIALTASTPVSSAYRRAPRIRLLRQPVHAPLPRMTGPSVSVLTRREREVAAHITRGLRNCEIAEVLVIATSTTERHVANILSKLDMRSRTEIAVWAAEKGLRRALP